MISPIKIFGETFGGENRSGVGIGGESEPPATSQSQDGPLELGASQIGELSHAVDRRRVHPLVSARSLQILLKNLEPERVFLLVRIRLAVLLLEQREVVLRPEQRIVAQSLANAGIGVDDLSDQRVIGVFWQRRRCGDQEKSGDEKERESVIHFFFFLSL